MLRAMRKAIADSALHNLFRRTFHLDIINGQLTALARMQFFLDLFSCEYRRAHAQLRPDLQMARKPQRPITILT
jgi:hypothetical protein